MARHLRILPAAVLSATAFFGPALGQAPITGSMNCEVTSNHIAAISDGRASEYSSIADRFGTGDTLRFLYLADPIEEELSLFLIDILRPEQPLMAWSSFRSLGGERLPSAPLTDTGNTLVSSDEFSRMTFGLDRVQFSNVFMGTDLSLERYFRTDWHGLGTRSLQLEGQDLARQIFTLDCRQSEERFQEALDAFAGISRP